MALKPQKVDRSLQARLPGCIIVDPGQFSMLSLSQHQDMCPVSEPGPIAKTHGMRRPKTSRREPR